MAFYQGKNYGWVVVAVSAVAMALIYSIRHTFSVFFPEILTEFGWSRAGTASIYSITILTYGFAALFAGTMGAKYSPKLLMCLGVVFTGAATAACSMANALWHFYLIYGVLAPIGMSFCGWPLLVPAVSNWHENRRGLAIAIAQGGSGFSFTVGLIIEPVIVEWGWRTAYVVQALLLVAVVLPLYVFLFRYRPEPSEFIRWEGESEGKPRPAAPVDWTWSGVMRSRPIWLMSLAYFFYWGVGVYLLLAHQVKFAQDVGFSLQFAASVFALFGVVSVVGMFSAGLSDIIGREAAAALATLLGSGATIALLMTDNPNQPWPMYLYSICLGLGAGLITPTIFSGAADIYHGRYYGTATGVILMGMGMGGALGPWLGGLIHDLSGSYRTAFILALICQLIGFGCFFFSAPRRAEAIRAEMARER